MDTHLQNPQGAALASALRSGLIRELCAAGVITQVQRDELLRRERQDKTP